MAGGWGGGGGGDQADGDPAAELFSAKSGP